MSIKKNKLITQIVLLLILMASFFVIKSIVLKQDPKHFAIEKFKKAYGKNLLVLTERIHELQRQYILDPNRLWDDKNIFAGNHYEPLFIFNKSQLVFWNNTEVNPDDLRQLFLRKQKRGIAHLGLGWYQFVLKRQDTLIYVALNTILKSYPVTNKYLTDYYNKDYLISDKEALTKNPRLSDDKIYSLDGKFLVGLVFKDDNVYNSVVGNILSFIWILIFSVLLILLINSIVYFNIKKSVLSPVIQFALYFGLAFVLFWVGTDYLLPAYLKQTNLFETWIPDPLLRSRGAAVLFSIYLLIISFKTLENSKPLKNSWLEWFKIVIISVLNFVLTLFLLQLLNNVYNYTLKQSDITIGFLFRHDVVELLFLVAIVLSVFFYQVAFYYWFKNHKRYFIINTLVASLAALVFYWLFPLNNPIIYLSTFLIQVGTPLIIYYTPVKQSIAFLRYLMLITLFTFSVTLIINKAYEEFKNINHQRVVAELTNRIDQDVVLKFEEIENDLQNDIIVKYMLDDSLADQELIDYISSDYMHRNFYNYDVQLTFCRKDYLLSLQPQGNVIACGDFFDDIKTDGHIINHDSSLFLIEDGSESSYYLGQITLRKDSLHNDRLFIELFSSVIPKDAGYPEIIVDENHSLDLSEYTIAKYENNELIYQYGGFDYHTDYQSIASYPDSSFFLMKDYIHYKVRLPGNKVLVVSRPAFTFSEKMGTFSVLFILFSLVSLILYVVYFGSKTLLYLRYSFNARLQIFFIVTLLGLFVLLAAITAYYFFNTRQTITLNQLNEKSKSVLMELQYNYGKEELSEDNPEVLQEALRELSMVFFTDINLYDQNGKLLATSQPKLFEEGFLAPVINPLAYKNIVLDKKLVFLNTEHIGKLAYFSEYVPISFSAAGINGILNLPYFTRQSKIKNSFFKMLFNYLNLFVLVGIMGTFVAILVSRFLTRPLLMLQKSLAELSITKKNEPLEWEQDDEIGQLIQEYNRMVKKLEESAELLKQTERESAWREIAQQIAHEIRNPLTPMKLNVQYLKKIYREDNEKFEQKFDLLTESIITQIEALNEVASMFSDLARNSSSELTRVDIIPLLRSAVLLYNNTSGINVSFETKIEKAVVTAREAELLRVFNNLIKNAVQAMNDEEGGKVTVQLREGTGFFEIRIIDNGKGISEEMKKKIFMPYFTTKSGGTGLGLAIVKNIIEELGGEIFFRSEEGIGSVFIIKLKKA